MVFSITFVLEYLLRDMKSLNPEMDLYGSRNKCASTNIVILPIYEVRQITVSLLNTHNHTKHTRLKTRFKVSVLKIFWKQIVFAVHD